MRTAWLSASHSSPGLPPHHRQRARCCLRLFCRRLIVCRNSACMLEWLMPLMVDRIMRTVSLSASHYSPGLPPRQRPRQRARCCLRLFRRRLCVVSRNCKCILVWLVWMVIPVILNRMTRTALLSASHCSPGLPLHYRKRERCSLQLLCCALSVCRTCTCMLVWLMP
jgi:hypothetical protein